MRSPQFKIGVTYVRDSPRRFRFLAVRLLSPTLYEVAFRAPGYGMQYTEPYTVGTWPNYQLEIALIESPAKYYPTVLAYDTLHKLPMTSVTQTASLAILDAVKSGASPCTIYEGLALSPLF